MAVVAVWGRVLHFWEIPGTAAEATNVVQQWARETHQEPLTISAMDKKDPYDRNNYTPWSPPSPTLAALQRAQNLDPHNLFVASCAAFYASHGRLTEKQLAGLRRVRAPERTRITGSYALQRSIAYHTPYGARREIDESYGNPRDLAADEREDPGFGDYEEFGW